MCRLRIAVPVPKAVCLVCCRACCSLDHFQRSIDLSSRIRKPLTFLSTMSNFQLILDALDKYAEQTGINLEETPFADKVIACDSSRSILLLLQENVKLFKEYRDKNRNFIDSLGPVVQFVHTFSDILGEAAGLVSCDHSSSSVYSFTSRFHFNQQN